jgi:hypothetical protein
MTAVLAAIDRENRRHTSAGEGSDEEPSEGYAKNLAVLRPEIANAEERLRIAAQRNAQTFYGRGMLIGAVVIAVLCAALGIGFYVGDVPAEYGVALPGGALGALVSVLQRMTSGSLQLDFNAGRRLLALYGAVRPIIGAIFGVVLFAALEGGFLPALDLERDERLGFYAALGFVAGFNERFAQDMLVGSARRLTAQAGVAKKDESSGARPGTGGRG